MVQPFKNKQLEIQNLSKHPLVAKNLVSILKKLKIQQDSVTVFSKGGIGILFILENFNGKKAILKIPAYFNRPIKEHWLLKHNIKKEATILEQLDNIAIPKLFYKDSNGDFLVREFIVGNPLCDYKNSVVTFEFRKLLLTALLNTVKILFKSVHEHSKGNFVLRDFKPANLIYSHANPDFLFFVDFGSLRSETDMVSTSIRSYRLGTGKWLYWSPEQLLEDKNILDRKTDYFSFAATAFFILTGKPPYSNSTTDKEKVMTKYFEEYEIIQSKLTENSIIGDLPKDLINLIVKCLHPIPNNRKFNF